MSLAPSSVATADIAGCFTHVETRATFEYIAAPADSEYPHLIFVGPNRETRMGTVLKTVAYIVVDEDDDGYIVERWLIRHQWQRAA